MNFFKFFPRMSYRFSSNAAVGTTNWALTMTDITRHVIVVEKAKQTITAMHDYVIQDGDRPDTVANKVYGGAEYTWIILVVNNILTLYDWPLTEHEFASYITDKYGSQANAVGISYYRTTQGDFVDSYTYYTVLDPADQGEIWTAWEYEWNKNEERRRIKIIPPEFVPLLQTELERAFA